MMTEPGPAPDEDGGHEESNAPDGGGPGAVASGSSSSVIDLRPGQNPVVLPPTQNPVVLPPADLRPTAHSPPEAAVSPDPGAPPASRPRRMPAHPSRSAFAAILPALVVLLATAVLVSFLLVRSAAEARDALTRSRAVVAEQSVRRATDDLWSGVLGLVAGGIGQQVVDADQVLTLVGAARSDPPGPVTGGADDGRLLQAAIDSHAEFVGAVADSFERTDADPIELGNELSALELAHARANQDGDALIASLDESAAGALSDSRRLAGTALVLGLIGLAGAVAAMFWARRRLAQSLDEPADAIATTLSRFADGDATVRIRRRAPVGLGALAVSVDEDLDAISAEFDRLHSRAAWGEQSRMIFEALDGAEDEDEAHDVIRRALSMIDESHHPVELLLADRGSTQLDSVAHDPTVGRPGCPVDTTGACVALRRGQVAVFDSSESINACPKLRDRPGGTCSAVCVPVTVAARPVGVLHMTGPDLVPPGSQVADRLVTLSVQIGNRLGALRTLESTRKDASTDKLTGLPNRRKLESEVATLLERGTPFVMVLADLDKFKKLNDNFGHEVGDKALQLFSGVLRDNVRGNDLVSRLGGEEFVLVYPNMSVEISIEAIGRVRQALARAIAASRLPSFTCSFGVTHSDVGGDGDWILRVADAGLLRAKELGGDQAVFADEELAATVFSNEAPPTLGAVDPDDHSGDR